MRILVTTVLAGALVAACAGDDDDDTTPIATTPTTPTPSPTTPTPTFTQVYSLLQQRCSMCHITPGGIGISLGALDLGTQALAYTNLVGQPSKGASCNGVGTLVVAGSAEGSLLFQKVRLDGPAPCGDKMPLGGPPLAQADVDLIAGWINGGANND